MMIICLNRNYHIIAALNILHKWQNPLDGAYIGIGPLPITDLYFWIISNPNRI